MLMSGGERQEKTQLKIEKEKAVPCGNKYKLKRQNVRNVKIISKR